MRFRLNWSLVLLGVSLSALSILALQAHLADRAHRKTAVAVLSDYAKVAAYNYEQVLRTRLSSVAASTLMHPGVHLHNDPSNRLPSLAALAANEKECDCRKPPLEIRGTLLYSIGRDSLQWIGAPVPGFDAREMGAWLERDYQNGKGHSGDVIKPIGKGQRFITYRTWRREATDTLLVGAWFDGAEVRSVFEKAFCPDALLPPALTRGLPIDSVLAVAVYAPGREEPLWSSAESPVWRHSAEDTLSIAYGGLIARAAIRPEVAERLIIGGLPRSRLPLLFALLGVSVALAVLAAVQMRREQALVRMRETFVTSVSHELRTPLAQIQLFLETLRMGRATSTVEREWALGHIERETTRLSHLVENVLHVARPRNGEAAAAPVINVGDEVKEIVQSFLPLARSRRARLVTHLDEDVLTAMRREHLRQIVLNLLDNAVKYGPSGQTVTISAEAQRGCVRVSVRDEGGGVRPEERDQIWRPYFRGSTPEAVASGGTGIGLTIVRDLARQYGGDVWLDSTGPGATFVVELPGIDVGPRVVEPGSGAAAAHAG
jgi:signal transduction histidine kinase